MLEKSIYHGLLIYYLKEKSRILEEDIGISEIETIDIKEINGWSISKIKNYFNALSNRFMITDSISSPWCYYYRIGGSCDTCKYGKRHGQCINNPGSTYGKILNKLREYGTDGIMRHYKIVDLIYDVIKYYNDISTKKFSYYNIFKRIALIKEF